MKRRIVSIIMAMALMVLLCACGSDKDQQDEAVDSKVDYTAFTGSYMDSVSGRATATAAENGDLDSVVITVIWADSAFESYQWQMTAEYSDGKLNYSDCVETLISYADDGNSTTEEIYSGGEGYFEWDGNNATLSWTGAADENCQSCVFEKIADENSDETGDVDADKVYLEFSDIMNEIYAVRAGSAGSSLRAEEALNALITFVDAYSGTSMSSDYESFANKWFDVQETDNTDIRTEFKECLDVVTEMAELNGKGTDVAYLNVVNGIYDAIG